jgi:DNA-binding MarR family transcriptional regulator
MQHRGLVAREANPADARSTLVRLLPAGRRTIEEAAPQHVDNVRRYFIDLLAPDELDTLAAIHERILRRLVDEAAQDDGTAES